MGEKKPWMSLILSERKYLFLLLIAVGFLFLSFGNGSKEEAQLQQQDGEAEEVSFYSQREQELVTRLATLLSQVEGAGEVQVMITYRTSGQKELAMEEKTERDGNTAQKQETTIVLAEGVTGKEEPILLSETAPEIEGIVILSSGGSNPVVQTALSSAASALFSVPAHKIVVLQKQ